MATLNDPDVQELLRQPNHAVISTHNKDGSIHQAMVWIDTENGLVAVNSLVGRLWPANLQRNPHATALVFQSDSPAHYVEIRGTATATRQGANEHADRLTKKYMGLDEYPWHQPGDERIKFLITPERVRHVKMG